MTRRVSWSQCQLHPLHRIQTSSPLQLRQGLVSESKTLYSSSSGITASFFHDIVTLNSGLLLLKFFIYIGYGNSIVKYWFRMRVGLDLLLGLEF